MPGFMGELRGLPWCNIDIRPLRIGQRLPLGGLGRGGVDPYIAQVIARERLDPGLEAVWQAGGVLPRARGV